VDWQIDINFLFARSEHAGAAVGAHPRHAVALDDHVAARRGNERVERSEPKIGGDEVFEYHTTVGDIALDGTALVEGDVDGDASLFVGVVAADESNRRDEQQRG